VRRLCLRLCLILSSQSEIVDLVPVQLSTSQSALTDSVFPVSCWAYRFLPWNFRGRRWWSFILGIKEGFWSCLLG
jgi:hypothetical protein